MARTLTVDDMLPELVSMYSALDFAEIDALFPHAEAEFRKAQTDRRNGCITASEYRDVKADFYAIRGVRETVLRRGAL